MQQVLTDMEKAVDASSVADASVPRPEGDPSKKPAIKYASKWKQKHGGGNQQGKQ
jgi:hypothetical protein